MRNFVCTTQTLAKLLFLLFVAAATSDLSAQVKLSVQGLVKKSDGTALPDGNYDLTFRFFNTEVGGAALATETVTTEINGGVYSAILGGGGGLDMLPFDAPYYVSVAVDGGTELLPRIALSAAPYAISLQGASNKFPSTGTVKTDAIDVAGAVNALAALNVTGTATLNGNTNTKTLYADGRVHSNTGFFYHNAGVGNSTGLFFNNSLRAGIYTNATDRFLAWDDNKNYYRATAGHVFDVGDVSMSGNQTVTGTSTVGNLISNGNAKANAFRARGGAPGGSGVNNNGYAFEGNNGDNDSGLFSDSDGKIQIYANGQEIMYGFTNGFNITRKLYLHDVSNGTDGDNLEWRSGDKVVGINTSSRRYKCNIQPLSFDFTRILQLQPKIYNRKSGDPNHWEVGYIAEEVDSLGMKNLVLYDEEGRPNSLIYKKFILYTNEVVKMHHADIEKLKAEVAALTAEKNALRTENSNLRADVQNQQANFGKQLDELSRRLKSLETAASNR